MSLPLILYIKPWSRPKIYLIVIKRFRSSSISYLAPKSAIFLGESIAFKLSTLCNQSM